MQCRGQSLISAFEAWYHALAADRVLVLQPPYLARVELGFTYLKVHGPIDQQQHHRHRHCCLSFPAQNLTVALGVHVIFPELA